MEYCSIKKLVWGGFATFSGIQIGLAGFCRKGSQKQRTEHLLTFVLIKLPTNQMGQHVIATTENQATIPKLRHIAIFTIIFQKNWGWVFWCTAMTMIYGCIHKWWHPQNQCFPAYRFGMIFRVPTIQDRSMKSCFSTKPASNFFSSCAKRRLSRNPPRIRGGSERISISHEHHDKDHCRRFFSGAGIIKGMESWILQRGRANDGVHILRDHTCIYYAEKHFIHAYTITCTFMSFVNPLAYSKTTGNMNLQNTRDAAKNVKARTSVNSLSP